ncbi:recombinase family protein [Sulfitobacter sp. LCG007]
MNRFSCAIRKLSAPPSSAQSSTAWKVWFAHRASQLPLPDGADGDGASRSPELNEAIAGHTRALATVIACAQAETEQRLMRRIDVLKMALLHEQSERESLAKLVYALEAELAARDELLASGQETREGLRGRALAGKSAGGLTYGYRAVRAFDAEGERIRGDREIHPEEAAVVVRIFKAYAAGRSPKKIAEQLNAEGVPGPRGGTWGASTIHGNRLRGTGILNNELYVGKQVWNRLSYAKDPLTGKRVSRMNPEDEWEVTEIPELRIVGDKLWQAVRSRQGALVSSGTSVPVWDRRRPKFLFSGLMMCGCCGGGFANKRSLNSARTSALRRKRTLQS